MACLKHKVSNNQRFICRSWHDGPTWVGEKVGDIVSICGYEEVATYKVILISRLFGFQIWKNQPLPPPKPICDECVDDIIFNDEPIINGLPEDCSHATRPHR